MRQSSIAAHGDNGLAALQDALDHQFECADLLLCALTHRSLANERQTATAGDDAAGGDNERLEFLGDAVIGLVVAEALFRLHPDWREGELTRVRAQLVSRKHMAQVAESIDLGRHVRLGRGEERVGLRHAGTVLSNTMEAVVGALYLDGGLEPVKAFVRLRVMGKTAEQLADELRSGAALGNYKSALQEHLQKIQVGSPVYVVKGESGPDHRKRFLVEVRLKPGAGEPGKPLARGVGTTKKLAEQDAARRAMARLVAQAAKGASPMGSNEEAVRAR